jgi:hypothetical protein
LFTSKIAGAGRLLSARLCHGFAGCRHEAITGTGQGCTNLVSFLAAITMLLSIAKMTVCPPAWAHGISGSWQVIDNMCS